MPALTRRRFQPGWLLTVLVLLSLAILVSLGTWQMQRLWWKLDLIERVEAGLAAAPVPLPDEAPAILALDLRPVVASGTLRLDRAFARGSEQQGGRPGARLVVPLERAGAASIIVDMGWIPEPVGDFLDGLAVAEEVSTLTGTLVLDHPAARPPFRPANDLERRRWFWYDTATLRAWTGLDDLAAATLVRRPGGIETTPPIASPAAMTLKNDHLGYALTWYGLAIGLLVIYVRLGLLRGKEATA